MPDYSFYQQETAMTDPADADAFIVADASAAGTVKKITLAYIRQQLAAGVVNCTASTLAVTKATHGGQTVTLNRAAGIAVTLPAASGTGAKFTFFIGTTVTSNSTTIKAASASDTMSGLAVVAQDGGDAVVGWETAADTDTITFDGTTTGGILGDQVELTDVASGKWMVRVFGSATGTEATPFSATVS